MNDEKRFCENCKRDIPFDNYQIHVIHCIRNIQLCPSCEEPVPRSEMEKHKTEFHSTIACTECRQKMERLAMSAHKENHCPKRIVSCQYCDLDLRADEIPEHQDYCGSRTDDCEECGKIIMLKFREFHVNSDHHLTNPNENNSSESDDNFAEDVEENFRNNYPSRFNRNSQSRSRENNHTYRSVPYENNSRRNQTRNARLVELDEYFGNMGIESMRGQQLTNARVHSVDRPGTSRGDEPIYIPCEFCDVPIIADELVLHETGCRPDLVSRQSAPSNPRDTWERKVKKENEIHEISEDDDDDDVQFIPDVHEISDEEEVLIPCEFCDRQFSLNTVGHHQVTCGNHFGLGQEY